MEKERYLVSNLAKDGLDVVGGCGCSGALSVHCLGLTVGKEARIKKNRRQEIPRSGGEAKGSPRGSFIYIRQLVLKN